MQPTEIGWERHDRGSGPPEQTFRSRDSAGIRCPMALRRRSKILLPLGDVLVRTLMRSGLSDQARRLLIFQCWDEAVGKEIAARTQPESFSRGVLGVRAQSASWQNELTYLKSRIIERINEFLGEPMVRDLRVVRGQLVLRAAAPPPPVNLEADVPASVRDQAKQCGGVIEDADVRGQFERLMCRHLNAARKRT